MSSSTTENSFRIQSAQDEKAWTQEHLADLLSRPCIPTRVTTVGNTTVEWEPIDPGIAFVRSITGGTSDDRRLAETIVATRLAKHSYERAQFSFDKLEKTAEWDDIMAKARRLINSGNVQLLRNSYNSIVAHVKGDHGEYTSEIGRDDPNSRAITTWQCECPWDQFAWQRTRQWKKYEGRPCAHVLAAFWLAQATPLDEELEPGQTLPPGQKGFQPQTPADIISLPQAEPTQPMLPGVNPALPQSLPPTSPGAPDILPPFPGEQLQLIPPGQLQPGQPGITVSEPGARQPTPFNPIQNPSTYSKVADWTFESVDANNIFELAYSVLAAHPEYDVDDWRDDLPTLIDLIYHEGMQRGINLMDTNTTDLTNALNLAMETLQRGGHGEGMQHEYTQQGDLVLDEAAALPWTAPPKGLEEKIPGWGESYPNYVGDPRFPGRMRWSSTFNEMDMVRLEEDEYGVLEGKSEEHGAGGYKLIPKGSIGEVRGVDQSTGWVDVIFAGPQADAGPMEPYHVRAIVEPGMLTAMPHIKKPGPFLKRP